MAITYGREMTMKYTLVEGIDDTQVYGRFLSELHDKGISTMDSKWDDGPSELLGLSDKTTTDSSLVINWKNQGNDIEIVCASSSLYGEAVAIVEQLRNYDIEAVLQKVTEETTVEEYGVPDGKRVFLSHEGVGSSTLTYGTEEGTDVSLTVDIWQDTWRNTDLTVKFSMSWTPSKIQKKTVIEDVLVDLPIEDMGRVQRIIEDNLNILGWDGEQPDIDCHFTHNTFSKSECAPDIVKRVRDARKAQDGTEEE